MQENSHFVKSHFRLLTNSIDERTYMRGFQKNYNMEVVKHVVNWSHPATRTEVKQRLGVGVADCF